MTEGGYYQAPRPRTASIAIVLMIHAAALTALALSKMEVTKNEHGRTEITWVETPKPPPEPTQEVEPRPPSKEITYQKPLVPIVIETPFDDVIETIIPPVNLGDEREIAPKVEPVPPPEPVRTEAQIDSRSELQPPYPASEQRSGVEGSVALRVLIGPDGRLKGAEKVRATNDTFYQATLRHALRNWRFKPATLDGRPVESRKVMTVRFRIES